MSPEPDLERFGDLVALAALGELSPDEQRELDRLADANPAMVAELDAAVAAAASVQSSVAESPPAALRQSVLDAIVATPQVGGDAAAPVAAPIDLGAERARRRGLMPLVAAAAAAVIFVVGAAVVVMSRDDGGGGDQIAAVVGASDAETRILTGEFEVMVTFAASQDAVVVEADGLPELTDEETYQLWLVGDGGAATSAGIFRPDDAGTVAVRIDDVDPTGFVLGVTEEPAGGSESPTLPILATA
jgi:anti-sigma-K factor RskA